MQQQALRAALSVVIACFLLAGGAVGCEMLGLGGGDEAADSAAAGTAADGIEKASQTELPEGNPHAGYCVVMGNAIDMEKAKAEGNFSDHEGKRYYFCCAQCKPKFEEDAAKWIASPAAPKK